MFLWVQFQPISKYEEVFEIVNPERPWHYLSINHPWINDLKKKIGDLIFFTLQCAVQTCGTLQSLQFFFGTVGGCIGVLVTS